MLDNYVLYFLNFILTIFFSFLLGFMIQRIFNKNCENKYFFIFSNILIGIITFSVVFAVIKTNFRTILLGSSILIIPFLLYKKKIIHKSSLKDNKKIIFMACELLIVIILTYIIKVIPFFTFKDYIILPNADYIFYAKMCEYVTQFGIENYSLEYIYPQNYLTPYHYIEIWAAASISYFLSGSYLFNLSIVTFGIFNVLIYYGFMSIVSTWTKPTVFVKIFIFFLLFFSCLDFSFFQYIPLLKNISSLSTTIWSIPKIAIVYVFILLAFYHFVHKDKNKGVLSLLFLCFFYTPVAPAIVSGIFLWVCIDFFVYKENKKIIIDNLFFITISTLFIGIFYFLFIEKNDKTLSTHSITFQYLKTGFNIIVGTNIQLFVIYFPILVLIFFYSKVLKKHILKNSFLLVFLSIYLCGLLSWAVMQTNLNASQLFYNISTPIFHILSVIIISYSIFVPLTKKIKILTFVFSTVFIFMGINQLFVDKRNQNFGYSFIQNIKNEFKNINNKIGVCFHQEDIYSSPYTTSNTSALGCYLSLFKRNTHTVDVTVFSIDKHKKNSFFYATYKKNLENSTFYKYVKLQKEKKIFQSIEQSQIDFIKKYKIEYIVISKEAKVSTKIKSLIKEEFKDDKSGEIFLLLK
ncbi:MAG: hypothetical protein EAZ44_00855 [Cytophagia bacterium]|nr:MAG: hypothetical protein EAZ44_00855 [Cytophagia bacterium]TAG44394.1 MAG: hypothetical protein EAZ31_02390 [Cytophagia bacterium]